MKKITYGYVTCEVSVSDQFSFYSEVPCEYEHDVIAYATERFLSKVDKMKEVFTKECWKVRVADKKRRKKYKFQYIVPASWMELPGQWVRIRGEVNAQGANVFSIAILKEHPLLKGIPN